MSLEVDLLLDRRRLKRRLTAWRVVAVLGVCAALGLALARGVATGDGRGFSGVGYGGLGGAHIARLVVSGIITDDHPLVRDVARLADDPQVKALEVEIDSPGGSVAGGESLHDAIARVAAKKPVVVVMGSEAASAGYMIAMPAARIFASPATLTGSIGVILETGEISGLLQKLGITATALVSGPLKDQPSFTRALSPAGREALQGLVMDLYDQFVTMVADGRHMDKARVLALADGRAFTGRQALQLGLVDQLGDETDARAWLAGHGIGKTLPVRDVRAHGWSERLLGASFGPALTGLLKTMQFQGVTLDGAWAIWQPGLTLPE